MSSPTPPVASPTTQVISALPPTTKDLEQTRRLEEALRDENLFESEAEGRHREYVLSQLNRVVQEWIYEVGLSNGMTDEDARHAGGKVFTFGSYRLGAVSPGSDIDALCVAPRHVSKDNFFQNLVQKLRDDPNVGMVQPVEDAHTPIVKLIYHGVDIDLLFARLAKDFIDKSLESLDDDDILKNLDEKSVRSVNGCRVADLILKLTPNHHAFRLALRYIKHWAKNRGVYSNILGFLGGVAWAILVAKTCQLYPNASANVIIHRFFKIWGTVWNWSFSKPVTLQDIQTKGPQSGLSLLKVWDPSVNQSDRQHIMPIITPAFPSMNTTHNVNLATKKIMLDEMASAYSTVEKIHKNLSRWQDVYEPLPFFSTYEHFIQIQILGQQDVLHKQWMGFILSRLRFLVLDLHSFEQNNIRILVHPWPREYKITDKEYPHASLMYIGINFQKPADSGPVDLRPVISSWVSYMCNEHQYQSSFAEAKAQGSLQMKINGIKQDDIPESIILQVSQQSPLDDESPSESEPVQNRKRISEQPHIPPIDKKVKRVNEAVEGEEEFDFGF
eukprot:GHVL01015425.1.p1 GENE.GHVL01015425.1~~GHVL01015425.1.p1  ORF type:complete len:557 (+),score=120.34 GHVL01015425.1:133-1803(+)